MIRIIIICSFLFFFCLSVSAQEDSDQQFLEFNLSGHSKDGQKSWEVKGESADIFDDTVKLKNVDADLYGEEVVNITAETGSLNKSSIHWDFICDIRTDSEILVDGELFYQNGEFKV